MRVELELLSEAHAAALQRLADDPEVSATSGVPHPCGMDVVQGWIDENRAEVPRRFTFAVLVEGQVAGASSLKRIDYEARQGELSYWVGRPFWGRGVGRRAAALLLDYAFGPLEMERVLAECLRSNNERSMRILRGLGFQEDPSRQDHPAGGRWGERFPGDVWVQTILHREEWTGR